MFYIAKQGGRNCKLMQDVGKEKNFSVHNCRLEVLPVQIIWKEVQVSISHRNQWRYIFNSDVTLKLCTLKLRVCFRNIKSELDVVGKNYVETMLFTVVVNYSYLCYQDYICCEYLKLMNFKKQYKILNVSS